MASFLIRARWFGSMGRSGKGWLTGSKHLPAMPGIPVMTNNIGVSVTLDWADNVESDLKGYRVYWAAAASGALAKWRLVSARSGPIAASVFIHTRVNGAVVGSNFYRVVAVDKTGHESLPRTATIVHS